MATKIRIDYAEVEVYEDSYSKGELGYVNSWDLNSELKGTMYGTAEQVVEAINKASFGLYSKSVSDYMFLDGRIDTDATVDVDNEEPSASDIAAWENGDINLYNAHLMVGLSVVSDDHEMTETEAEEFGFELY